MPDALPTFELRPAGHRGIEVIPKRPRDVHHWAAALTKAQAAARAEDVSASPSNARQSKVPHPGFIDIVPGPDRILVVFPPGPSVTEARLSKLHAWIRAGVRSETAGQNEGPPTSPTAQATLVRLPVCYAPEFAPDLPCQAERLGWTTKAYIACHAGASYRCEVIGFRPGFPYLSGLPSVLAVPRRQQPRPRIPPGSVAIGGAQAGVYPVQSPGGWQLVGCTPLRIFRPERFDPRRPATAQPLDEVFLFSPGVDVAFDPIDQATFARLAQSQPPFSTFRTQS